MCSQIGIVWAMKWLDSGKTLFDKIPSTKKVTIAQFVEQHSGMEGELYRGYAFIFNTIFVTFTYGLALPILWPITLFTLLNHYITEKILYAYSYRKPPMYGNKMSDGALYILTKAPLFLLSFGYWQLGNRQIFFNESQPITLASDDYDPGHMLFDFKKVAHTWIFLIFIPLMLYYREFVKEFRRIMVKFGLWIPISNTVLSVDMDFKIDPNVDENIGNYWNCLNGLG